MGSKLKLNHSGKEEVQILQTSLGDLVMKVDGLRDYVELARGTEKDGPAPEAYEKLIATVNGEISTLDADVDVLIKVIKRARIWL